MEETLYGAVTKVTYYSEETHFAVIKIKLDYQDHRIAKHKAKLFTDILTVTCNFDRKPLIDEEFDFVGEFTTNQYGVQFKARKFSRRNEKSLEGVITYLSSELFPGIGKVAATKVFNTLGSECLSIIENDRSSLEKVDISDAQKETIYTNIINYESNKRTIIGLLDLGITMRMSLKLIKILGNNAVDIINENPYQLMDLVEGFGFRRSDKIALDNGFDTNSPLRIKSLLIYLIRQLTFSSGDTYLDFDELFQKACNELNYEENVLDIENYNVALQQLIEENKIIIEDNNKVFDIRLYASEFLLAKKVNDFLNRDQSNGYNINEINKVLKNIEEKNNIEYSLKQRDAIISAIKESIVIITGGPGTGKSTIIKGFIECILNLYGNETLKEKIALLAPTGRAAKRLKELTAHNAMTIHRFLGYEGHGTYKQGPQAKVDAKIVIVDEMSMVDVSLAARLFSSLEDDVKIVLVGDVDQLPSVSPGEVLSDLINSKEITTIVLNQIHRQASDSTIISLAHSVNNGYVPENILEKQHDRNFLNMQDGKVIAKIIKTIEQALSKGMCLIKDIQVLVPMYKGEIGINALNHHLQAKFNPSEGVELKHMNRIFRTNDKVIQLVNRTDKKVMNGDIGYIISINQTNDETTGLSIMFDVGSVEYQKDELEDLTHAYAISIHKSQGSEFDLVIVLFSYRYYIMLKRKLIYTAITRAKKYLVMLGNIEAFCKGIIGIEEKRRTKLLERIKENISNVKKVEYIDMFEMENLSPYDFME